MAQSGPVVPVTVTIFGKQILTDTLDMFSASSLGQNFATHPEVIITFGSQFNTTFDPVVMSQRVTTDTNLINNALSNTSQTASNVGPLTIAMPNKTVTGVILAAVDYAWFAITPSLTTITPSPPPLTTAASNNTFWALAQQGGITGSVKSPNTNQTVSFTGFTYTITAGSLPPGYSASSSATITATPSSNSITVSISPAGSYYLNLNGGTIATLSNASSYTITGLNPLTTYSIDLYSLNPITKLASTTSTTLAASSGFTAVNVTIQAVNGSTQTFNLKSTDWTAWQTTNNATVTNIQTLQNQTSVTNTTNDIANFLNSNNVVTFTAVNVTIQAGNGNTKLFNLKSTDWTAWQTTNNATVTNIQTLQNQTSVTNTTNDIVSFLNSNQQQAASNYSFTILAQNGQSLSNQILSQTDYPTASSQAIGYHASFNTIITTTSPVNTTISNIVTFAQNNQVTSTTFTGYSFTMTCPDGYIVTNEILNTSDYVSWSATAINQGAKFSSINQTNSAPNTTINDLNNILQAHKGIVSTAKYDLMNISKGVFAGLLGLSLLTGGTLKKGKKR